MMNWATLIAVGFDAEALIICTSVGGFMNDEKKIIPFVDKIDNKILGYVKTDKTNVGLGGMVSKLTFTRLANSLGIQVIICGVAAESLLPLR
jgi:glutamate 5-kinase